MLEISKFVPLKDSEGVPIEDRVKEGDETSSGRERVYLNEEECLLLLDNIMKIQYI